MHVRFLLALSMVGACAGAPYVEPRATATLAHPSATGSVQPNLVKQLHVSITKLTDTEICIDEAILRSSEKDEGKRAYNEVLHAFEVKDYQLGRCTSSGKYCDPEPLPVTQTFKPVLVRIGEDKYMYSKKV